MKATQLICLTSIAALTLSGCETMSDTQRNTAIGAGGGAAAGAIIGAVTGSRNVGRDAVIGAGLGALGSYIWSRRMEDQKQAMEQATAGTGVTVTHTEDDQLKIEIPSDISFEVNRADIQPNLRPILDRFAQTLRDNQASSVRIVGHTDSTGTDAINNPLSVNRAASVRDYLVDRGVAAGRIAIDGRGSREPIASNDTPEGRAKNRRVEIFVAETQAPR
jgi:outer membrane protein OmpA-like peptidoglycan-associated protein